MFPAMGFYDSLLRLTLRQHLGQLLSCQNKVYLDQEFPVECRKLGDKLNQAKPNQLVDRERFLACASRINMLTAFKLHRFGSICIAN